MRITPIDIAHKSFQRKMMGLDPDQVMDFLRFVADEMETVIRERNSLKETLREKELSVSEYRERDELLKNTITTATRMSEKMQADAERESKLILQDANQKAEMIVRDARDSLKRIYQDISDLKRIRLQFENNLKALIQSHMAMMEQGQKIMPNPSLDPSLGIDDVEEVSSSHQKEIEKRVTDAISAKVKPAEY
ncbi:MAG: cell division protein DivIVA [Bdellovibrionaceae bacterium]|mgnify:CR=1 FL=1|nr:cell division protein DivIVA [Pseudobdellovibrionaceae bacterium]|tara:strand:- start:1060 stop:1638 length:579 start_codon:yes stop_codon:yes gene_type:complete